MAVAGRDVDCATAALDEANTAVVRGTLGVSESAVSMLMAGALKRLEQDFCLRDWLGLTV